MASPSWPEPEQVRPHDRSANNIIMNTSVIAGKYGVDSLKPLFLEGLELRNSIDELYRSAKSLASTTETYLFQYSKAFLSGDLVGISARTWLGRWRTRRRRSKMQIEEMNSPGHTGVAMKCNANADGWTARTMKPAQSFQDAQHNIPGCQDNFEASSNNRYINADMGKTWKERRRRLRMWERKRTDRQDESARRTAKTSKRTR
jgi:hypothetical protein